MSDAVIKGYCLSFVKVACCRLLSHHRRNKLDDAYVLLPWVLVECLHYEGAVSLVSELIPDELYIVAFWPFPLVLHYTERKHLALRARSVSCMPPPSSSLDTCMFNGKSLSSQR